jgi:hypothetical protein
MLNLAAKLKTEVPKHLASRLRSEVRSRQSSHKRKCLNDREYRPIDHDHVLAHLRGSYVFQA